MNMGYTKTLAFLAFSTVIAGKTKITSHCMDNKRRQMTISQQNNQEVYSPMIERESNIYWPQ